MADPAATYSGYPHGLSDHVPHHILTSMPAQNTGEVTLHADNESHRQYYTPFQDEDHVSSHKIHQSAGLAVTAPASSSLEAVSKSNRKRSASQATLNPNIRALILPSAVEDVSSQPSNKKTKRLRPLKAPDPAWDGKRYHMNTRILRAGDLAQPYADLPDDEYYAPGISILMYKALSTDSYCGRIIASRVPEGEAPRRPKDKIEPTDTGLRCINCGTGYEQDKRSSITNIEAHFLTCVKENGNPQGFHVSHERLFALLLVLIQSQWFDAPGVIAHYSQFQPGRIKLKNE